MANYGHCLIWPRPALARAGTAAYVHTATWVRGTPAGCRVPGCDRDSTIEPGARPMRTRHSTFRMRSALAAWASLLAGAGLLAAPALGASTPAAAGTAKGASAKPTLVYPHLALP